jgi:glutaminyl-peptide cyclotransferase
LRGWLSLALLVASLVAGCNYADAGGRAAGTSPSSAPPASQPASPSASPPVGTAAADVIQRPSFDEKKSWAQLLKQCAFGPRPVGSAAHKQTRDYLVAEMQKYADKTVAQDFTYRGMTLTNVIGVFNPEAKRQILLCGHWDTRPTADMEIDAVNRKKPIIGASDGASEIAVLLELARLFKEQKPGVGIVVVFLDGEDYGDFDRDEGVFLGAKYFAKNHKGYEPEYGILLDMVGDKDLNIYRDRASERFAPAINNKVFRIARELGYGKYFIDNGQFTDVNDDHIALNQAGIPTIDLIDFDYGSWHRLSDTPDSCSPNSLKVVGEVVAEVVYRERAK